MLSWLSTPLQQCISVLHAEWTSIGAADLTCTNSVLMRAGNTSCRSKTGPIAGRSKSSTCKQLTSSEVRLLHRSWGRTRPRSAYLDVGTLRPKRHGMWVAHADARHQPLAALHLQRCTHDCATLHLKCPHIMPWPTALVSAVTHQAQPLSRGNRCLTCVGGKVVGTRALSRIGSPMSTHTCPSSSMAGCMRPGTSRGRVCQPMAGQAPSSRAGARPAVAPASVAIRCRLGPLPSRSATNRARHRMPFPHISGSLPSEL